MRVKYARLFSFGNFENRKIGFSEEVSSGDASKKLLDFVDQANELHILITEYEEAEEDLRLAVNNLDRLRRHLEGVTIERSERGQKKEIKKNIKACEKRIDMLTKRRDLCRDKIKDYPL